MTVSSCRLRISHGLNSLCKLIQSVRPLMIVSWCHFRGHCPQGPATPPASLPRHFLTHCACNPRLYVSITNFQGRERRLSRNIHQWISRCDSRTCPPGRRCFLCPDSASACCPPPHHCVGAHCPVASCSVPPLPRFASTHSSQSALCTAASSK